MVGGGKLQGKKRKKHIQENGAPNNGCLLDPGWARQKPMHYTRHAEIPCTLQSYDFSHTTILMREILQYTMESTLLYWNPEMSDETRNEWHSAPYHSAMSWHSCLLFWLLVVAIMREKVFYTGNQKWVMKPEMSYKNLTANNRAKKKIYLFIMVLQYKSREI